MRLKIEFNLHIQHISFQESFEKCHIIPKISIDYTILDLFIMRQEIHLIRRKTTTFAGCNI